MNRIRLFYALIGIFIFFYACDKEVYVPDQSIEELGESYSFSGEVIVGIPDSAKMKIDFEYIDNKILNIKIKNEVTREILAAYISRISNNEGEIAYAIFRWITDKIRYNKDMRLTWENQSSDSVFINRAGVCTGYSQLYANIAIKAGLKAVRIIGYAKGADHIPGNVIENENHVWNAVMIDNKWYLLDATWGSGYESASEQFIKEFKIKQFLVLPEKFIETRFPSEEKWQLLPEPITKEAFEASAKKAKNKRFINPIELKLINYE